MPAAPFVNTVIPRLHDEASSTTWLDSVRRSSSWLEKRFTMKPAS